ncbi:omega amino acid--pyruvate aminotransferase [Pandoraea terrae]|uniref:Omega amino acid--pyruvate aminotransferase n=1 Tax=Pandoraea terrae TaxID=1537710 RepID=A0A5E4XJ66_9BURK|nr:aminotransferase class III-fold pyridoxal phosphate-dependent enzyme [Pandoraea terrae]VVE36205.1 omega amino acid--pyruvate aminotransferase [Pandoraea terrae]
MPNRATVRTTARTALRSDSAHATQVVDTPVSHSPGPGGKPLARRAARVPVHALGTALDDGRGREWLDGASGRLCSPAGQSHPAIAAAVAQQLGQMAVLPAGLEPHSEAHAHRLASRLAALAADALCAGAALDPDEPPCSIGVRLCAQPDDAWRMAIGAALAWHDESGRHGNTGRNIVLTDGLPDAALRFALHGVAHRADRLLGFARVPQPRLVEDKFVKGQPADGARLAEAFRQTVSLLGADRIAAVVIEPLGTRHGVFVPPHGYLEAVREVCAETGIVLIFDERHCAFGRSGAAFAAQRFGVAPDLLVLGDVLTNGALPMGAVLAADGFAEALNRLGADTLLESTPTSSGPLSAPSSAALPAASSAPTPAAVAAAHALLDLCEREALFARAAEHAPRFLHDVFALADLPVVSDIRGYGLLAGLAIDGMHAGARAPITAAALQRRLFDAGLIVQTAGDMLLLAPALTASRAALDEMGARLRAVLSACDRD